MNTRRASKMTRAEIQQASDMFENGATMAELMRYFERTQDYIERVLNQNNAFTSSEKIKILELNADNVHYKEIAKQIGRSGAGVYGFLKKQQTANGQAAHIIPAMREFKKITGCERPADLPTRAKRTEAHKLLSDLFAKYKV